MDLETATNAGMKSLAVAWGYHDVARLVAAGAGQVADSPSSLLDMLVNA
jgi:phosphoglycolate phosphatase